MQTGHSLGKNHKEDKTMKTKAILFTAMALLMIACTKETIVENNSSKEENTNLISLSFFGSIEGSKTVLGEDGKTVKWLEGDAISVYPASGTTTKGGVKFTTNGDGWFTNETGIEASDTYYALYYYRNSQWVSDKNAIQTKLFPDQLAKTGSFSDDLAYMAGKIDLDKQKVEFKNICSHIRFTLSEEIAAQGVKSLTLMGNKGETISGTIQISFDKDGNPSVLSTDPDIYVRLHNNGENLAAGDYYFTILPQTFDEGFTVILSKEDGTQIAAKTTKNTTAVSTRNSILRMGTPNEYKNHLNYFVKYLDGFDITVGDPDRGGYKFNNTTHKDGKMLHDGKSNKTISADGVYFIDNHSSNIKVKYNELDNLIICAVDSDGKATIENQSNLQPKTNPTGVLLFENMIIINSTDTDVIQQQKAAPGTEFGYIVFDNCILKDLPRHVIYIINAATKINTISISNCDYSTTGPASSFITFASQASTVKNVYAYNNVFYYSGSSSSNMTDFKILNIQAGTVDNLVIQNNTFAKTTIPNAGLAVAGKVNKTGIIQYNLFDDVVVGTLVNPAKHSTLVNLKFDSDTGKDKIQPYKAENVNITYNYFYSKFSIQDGTQYVLNKGNLEGSISNSTGTPVKLSQSPLSEETWKPANYTYGPYTITPVETGKEPGSNFIGAKRHDTIPASNTASYRYAPNDLGSF